MDRRTAQILIVLTVDCATLVAPPVVFLALYLSTNQLGAATAFAHFFVLTPALLALLSIRIALALIFKKAHRSRAFLESLTVAIAVSILMFYYSLCALSLSNWGRVITLEIALAFSGDQLSALLQSLGISFYVLSLSVFLVLFGFVTGLFFLYRSISLSSLLVEKAGAPWSQFLLISGMIAAFGIGLRISNNPPGNGMEPITLTFFQEHFEERLQGLKIDGFDRAIRARAHKEAERKYTRGALEKPRNIFVFLVDGLRADRLSSLGYERETTPILDGYKKAGRFSHLGWLYSTCSESACGLLGIEASQYADALGDDLFSLSDILGIYGYQRFYLLSGKHKIWHGLTDAYGEDSVVLDASDYPDFAANDDRALIEMLNGVVLTDNDPVYMQFHLMSAHQLGFRFVSDQRFEPQKNYAFPLFRGSYSESNNYYDNGVLQADFIIGAILHTLETKGVLDDSIVLISGDHGESLGENGIWGHSNGVFPPELTVPILFSTNWSESDSASTHIEFASVVDIAPTIARSVGLNIPEIWTGQPYFASRRLAPIRLAQDGHRSMVFIDTDDEYVEILCDVESGAIEFFQLDQFGKRLISDKPEATFPKLSAVDSVAVEEFLARHCVITDLRDN